jgi:hypothetical protein
MGTKKSAAPEIPIVARNPQKSALQSEVNFEPPAMGIPRNSAKKRPGLSFTNRRLDCYLVVTVLPAGIRAGGRAPPRDS